ncbi:hypothetical protein EMEDMD4_50038 [Sinorhizobium medicae]|uniref:Uncharacterized protein n=1 Tax=Sinorhizobium medicae TaxID=110321 RepID=A0A508X356_9HYPH|nr:hypothetical protein EMEDMD4_50038 [Sinorhizobium medicae]
MAKVNRLCLANCQTAVMIAASEANPGDLCLPREVLPKRQQRSAKVRKSPPPFIPPVA